MNITTTKKFAPASFVTLTLALLPIKREGSFGDYLWKVQTCWSTRLFLGALPTKFWVTGHALGLMRRYGMTMFPKTKWTSFVAFTKCSLVRSTANDICVLSSLQNTFRQYELWAFPNIRSFVVAQACYIHILWLVARLLVTQLWGMVSDSPQADRRA